LVVGVKSSLRDVVERWQAARVEAVRKKTGGGSMPPPVYEPDGVGELAG
jgi:hypothetical protein